MKNITALAALSALVFPMVTWAGYYEDAVAAQPSGSKNSLYAPTVKEVDVSKYSSTEMEIKKSVLRNLISKGWEIQKHARYKITAQYKNTTMEVNINGAHVEFRETSAPFKSENGWIASAADNLIVDAEYYYQVRQAEKLIDAGAK